MTTYLQEYFPMDGVYQNIQPEDQNTSGLIMGQNSPNLPYPLMFPTPETNLSSPSAYSSEEPKARFFPYTIPTNRPSHRTTQLPATGADYLPGQNQETSPGYNNFPCMDYLCAQPMYYQKYTNNNPKSIVPHQMTTYLQEYLQMDGEYQNIQPEDQNTSSLFREQYSPNIPYPLMFPTPETNLSSPSAYSSEEPRARFFPYTLPTNRPSHRTTQLPATGADYLPGQNQVTGTEYNNFPCMDYLCVPPMYYQKYTNTYPNMAPLATSSSGEMVCSVCQDRAEGFHFGAVSCAACSAFFRRSISDQKVYSCTSRKCSVRFESQKRGGTCRYCRFTKCLASGMLPYEVRAKRAFLAQRGIDRPRSSPPQSNRTLQPTMFMNGSVVELLINVRRDIAQNKSYRREHIKGAPVSFSSLKASLNEEWVLFRSLVTQHSVIGNLVSEEGDSNKKLVFGEGEWHQMPKDSVVLDLFLMYYVHEIVWSVLSGGGIQLDRMYLPNGTPVDLSDKALRQFYTNEQNISDPACMARLSTSCLRFLVQTLARSVQGSHLDETETSLLFYIALSQVVPHRQRTASSENTRCTVFVEVAKIMEAIGADYATKLGNVLMLISPMMLGLQHLKWYQDYTRDEYLERFRNALCAFDLRDVDRKFLGDQVDLNSYLVRHQQEICGTSTFPTKATKKRKTTTTARTTTTSSTTTTTSTTTTSTSTVTTATTSTVETTTSTSTQWWNVITQQSSTQNIVEVPGQMFVEAWLPSLFAPKHRLLHVSFIFFIVPYLYSYLNEQNRLSSFSVEQGMFLAWEQAIAKPGAPFRKAVVGFNCNVDMIVPGVQVVDSLNTTCSEGRDHEFIENLSQLHASFAHFFQRGAAAERYMSSEESFSTLVSQAEKISSTLHHIGGNAALMAQRIASAFPNTDVYLVGPIGPRSQALLHPAVIRTNSTRIVKDEMHMILEYKQGEILGDWVAPSSSRFITSHDQFSGSTVVIEMFFKAISQFKPDLVIITGIHLMEYQNKDMRLEKLRMIRRNLLQINEKVPIHLQMGSLADSGFMDEVLTRIIPHVDSLGINEQELAFLSHVAGGPYTEEYPTQAGTIHVHKVVEMLYWLLKTYGRNRADPKMKNFGYRLQRIHFHCLTYHLMVSSGGDWSNLEAGLAAGARFAGKLSCNLQGQENMEDMLELRTSPNIQLDKHIGKTYHFDAHNPISSWMRGDVLFIYTPVLVCKFPTKTVGVEDVIAAQGLLYSQFYRSNS